MNAPSKDPRQKSRSIVPTLLGGAVIVVVVAVVIWLLPVAKGAAVQQPIRFSHAVHTKLMTCEFCHEYYKTRDVAGRPPLVRCMMCHAYPVTNNPEAAKLQKFAADFEEVPWVRLTRLPDFVHFSHQRHVVVGRLQCKTCHGDIAQTTAPPSAPLVTIRMQFCLGCHRSAAVELTEHAVQALQAAKLSPALQEALPDFENRRFPSAADLIGALAKDTGSAPAEAERQQILGQVRPAPKLTTDCIGCHR